MIENGKEIFARLEEQWQFLHVEKRYANKY